MPPFGTPVPKTSSTITLDLVEKTNPYEGNLSVPKPHGFHPLVKLSFRVRRHTATERFSGRKTASLKRGRLSGICLHEALTSTNFFPEYRDQRKYAEAEPLFRRALLIAEKTLGPEHPNVAQVLENYADLLRKMGRAEEATEMEARAQAIRAKIAHQ